MLRHRVALPLGVLLAYTAIAVGFTWPLALHLGDAFLGRPSGDTGIYVWNIWLFRHEIVAHQSYPFHTAEILSLTPPVPLTLHNYTTAANVVAFPLLPWLGTVVTFNVLTLASLVLAAFSMFVLARRWTNQRSTAFVAGLLFGFCPYMIARSTEHFSLVQAAPLPLFGLIARRAADTPSARLAVAAGVVVAWAYLSDPYYAVYCLMILLFIAGRALVTVRLHPGSAAAPRASALLNLALICMTALIVAMLVRGGWLIQVFGRPLRLERLYTPVMILVVLAALRLWVALRPRLVLRWPPRRRWVRFAAVAGAACLLVLAPLLYAMSMPGGDPLGASPRVLWRSSAPGVDLLAFLAPNPLHHWLGGLARGWTATRPNGFVENVASIPLTAIATILVAAFVSRRWPDRPALAFTGLFALLALGPFVTVAGTLTYVPTPWALVRYLPVIGAARMPSRLTILVMLGCSTLLAMAIQQLQLRVARPRLAVAAITGLLLAELMPAPMPLYSATVPEVFRTIAADPRDVRVLMLPFGLRDGLRTVGHHSTEYQYYQTVHQKPLIGGYVSRLPHREVARYRRLPVTRALLQLSDGEPLTDEQLEEAIASAHREAARLNIGWVAVDTPYASDALLEFAVRAFDLQFVTAEGQWKLYRAPRD